MHMLLASKLGALGVLLSDVGERAAEGLSLSAVALLLALHDRPGATATELAGIVGITQPTAVRVVEGLKRRGLTARRRRAGRTAPLCLTAAGKRRSRLLLSARLCAIGSLIAGLSIEERASLEQTLDKVLRAATTSRAFARTTCRLCDHGACDGPRCPIGMRASELERGTGVAYRGGEAC